MAYCEKEKKGENLWILNGNIGPFHADNLELTIFMRNFVRALHPDLQNRDNVVNRAIKTYYESKYTVFRKQRANPGRVTSNAKKQRKIHKAERRCKTVKKHLFQEDEKEVIVKCLVPEMMSSEDEEETENGERYFVVHVPKFRTKKFNKLIKVIDNTYLKHCSKRSKDQMIRREKGEPLLPSAPKSLKYGYDIFVNKDI